MKNGAKMAFSFLAGTAAGATVAWFLLKTHYEKVMNDEIASFKAEYKQRMEEKKEATKNLEEITDALKAEQERVEAVAKASDIAEEEGYYVHEDGPFDDGVLDRLYRENKQKGEPDIKPSSGPRKKPYVISPDELGDEQYEICVLTYYADGVLTNDWDEVIEDIEGTVGKESLKTFGKYEDDAVYVRNDELELDYEINKDTRRYVDIGPDDTEYDE